MKLTTQLYIVCVLALNENREQPLSLSAQKFPQK